MSGERYRCRRQRGVRVAQTADGKDENNSRAGTLQDLDRHDGTLSHSRTGESSWPPWEATARGFIHRWKRPGLGSLGSLGPMGGDPRLSNHSCNQLEQQENLRFALSLIDRGTGFLSMTSSWLEHPGLPKLFRDASTPSPAASTPLCHDRRRAAPPRVSSFTKGVC